MDFPSAVAHRPVLSSWSLEAVGIGVALHASAGPGSAVWPTANLAIHVPFAISIPYLVRRVWWANGSAVAGNVDCGVYTRDGTLLFSAGSTAQAGTTDVQDVALGTPFLLQPGSYFMALAASSVSAAFIRRPVGARDEQLLGVAQQATAVPLPATFTQASVGNNYIPLFGIARASVI